jgi:hypothetical protein
MQLAAFEQLKLTGLLCSRFSTSVRKGRRFFTLAGEDAELPNGRGDKKRDASRRRQQRPTSPEVSAPDGGSRAEGGVAEDPLVVPGPSGLDVRQEKELLSVPAEKPAAAAEPAGESAAAVPAARPAAAEPAAAVPTAGPAAVAVPATGESAAAVPAEKPAAVKGRPVLGINQRQPKGGVG